MEEFASNSCAVTPRCWKASILSTCKTGWRFYPCCAVQGKGIHGGGVLPQPHSGLISDELTRPPVHVSPPEAVSHLMRVAFRARQPGAWGGQILFPGQKDGAARPGAWRSIGPDPQPPAHPAVQAPASGCATETTWAHGAVLDQLSAARGAGPAIWWARPGA